MRSALVGSALESRSVKGDCESDHCLKAGTHSMHVHGLVGVIAHDEAPAVLTVEEFDSSHQSLLDKLRIREVLKRVQASKILHCHSSTDLPSQFQVVARHSSS